MSDETIDHETGEMVVLEPTPIIFIPSPQDAVSAWNAYQELCKALLDDNDYVVIKTKKGPKTARKRTGWAKLRRALNISTQIVHSEWQDFSDNECGYEVTVRASFPDGRFEDGDGYCDSYELGDSYIKATRHNIRAKAITRAKNRATADVIGSGEVSAEEFVDETPRPVVAVETNGQKDAFFTRALREIPYYKHKKHVINTLFTLGIGGYNPDKEEEMITALQGYAKKAANEEAKAA